MTAAGTESLQLLHRKRGAHQSSVTAATSGLWPGRICQIWLIQHGKSSSEGVKAGHTTSGATSEHQPWPGFTQLPHPTWQPCFGQGQKQKIPTQISIFKPTLGAISAVREVELIRYSLLLPWWDFMLVLSSWLCVRRFPLLFMKLLISYSASLKPSGLVKMLLPG